MIAAPVRRADERPTQPRRFSASLTSKAQSEALILAANRPGFRDLGYIG